MADDQFGQVFKQVFLIGSAGLPNWHLGWRSVPVDTDTLEQCPLVQKHLGTASGDTSRADAVRDAIGDAIVDAVGLLPREHAAACRALFVIQEGSDDALGEIKVLSKRYRQERAARILGCSLSGFKDAKPGRASRESECLGMVTWALLGKEDDPGVLLGDPARLLSLLDKDESNESFGFPYRFVEELEGDLLPELVVALVRPIGTDTAPLVSRLWRELQTAGYLVAEIRISRLIEVALESDEGAPEAPADTTPYQDYLYKMSGGDYLRAAHNGPATAALACRAIGSAREEIPASAQASSKNGVAYIVTNLMNPGEVEALRDVYGKRFFLLGVFGDRTDSLAALTQRLKQPGDRDDGFAKARAETLISIDAGDQIASELLARELPDYETEFGEVPKDRGRLSLNDTFHLADIFTSPRGTGVDRTIERFVHQVFSCPWGVLSPDEMAMGEAYNAALRSSALARRVGAAVVDPHGTVVSVGWNDVVRLGGATYDEGDDPCLTERHTGGDPSDHHRLDSIAYFLSTLRAYALQVSGQTSVAGDDDDAAPEPDGFEGLGIAAAFGPPLAQRMNELLRAAASLPEIDSAVVAGLASVPALKQTRLLNLIEFGKCVHAEMMALGRAAAAGRSTRDSTLYVTTFPCHECARNIVAAGISRVVFVEQYPKSLASKLYDHEIEVRTAPSVPSGRAHQTRLVFEPYEGTAPQSFSTLFSDVARKTSMRDHAVNPEKPSGAPASWHLANGRLRPSVRGYSSHSSGKYANASTLLMEADLNARFDFKDLGTDWDLQYLNHRRIVNMELNERR